MMRQRQRDNDETPTTVVQLMSRLVWMFCVPSDCETTCPLGITKLLELEDGVCGVSAGLVVSQIFLSLSIWSIVQQRADLWVMLRTMWRWRWWTEETEHWIYSCAAASFHQATHDVELLWEWDRNHWRTDSRHTPWWTRRHSYWKTRSLFVSKHPVVTTHAHQSGQRSFLPVSFIMLAAPSFHWKSIRRKRIIQYFYYKAAFEGFFLVPLSPEVSELELQIQITASQRASTSLSGMGVGVGGVQGCIRPLLLELMCAPGLKA